MCRDAVAPVQGTIGKVQDGSYELELSADRMAAMITLLPQGRPSRRAADGAPGAGRPGHRPRPAGNGTGRGRRTGSHRHPAGGARHPPTRGTPTRFESLLDRLKPRAQEIDELAQVDYRDLGSLLLVTPGTPLMRRIPPLPGIDGRDVLGQPVLPDEMADTQFSSDMSGVEIDPEDPCCCARRSPAAPS